jgi:hypothetical protein
MAMMAAAAMRVFLIICSLLEVLQDGNTVQKIGKYSVKSENYVLLRRLNGEGRESLLRNVTKVNEAKAADLK